MYLGVDSLKGFFKELEECKAYGNCQPKKHVKESYLSRIHVGIDVKKEDDIRDRDELSAELYRGACSNEDEDEELEEV